VLEGNFDNFTGQKWQERRWASFEDLLDGATVDLDRVKEIMSYHKPGANGNDFGDIYNSGTIQSLAYSYAENRLYLWLARLPIHPTMRRCRFLFWKSEWGDGEARLHLPIRDQFSSKFNIPTPVGPYFSCPHSVA